MQDEQFMKAAIQLAYDNVISGHGGPFGAVVVKDGQIIGRGCNEVTAACDPTAHAEVQAIREACRHLNSFQLEDCVIYTSCEPCPMCIGAIYWARPKAVFYACTQNEAAAIGFDDRFIYEQIALPMEQRSVVMKQMYPPESPQPFEAWAASAQKVEY
ncbi:guanine deaminase [Paenibacillus sp. UNCCL117]|uniref:nucleoside deaminase n=1 Tax=unclassified Paenibacillus TaxID=185978 RepID=UPI00087FCFF9|nr:MULTISPECIES: nucleoside deaminase [unclassified Paenibacillus]SDE01406.1 guanine deaminase [Paenibacillus sp. cl123]SFW56987.1 guanine deaminase [Paenibacillus sp. UNCCL117]